MKKGTKLHVDLLCWLDQLKTSDLECRIKGKNPSEWVSAKDVIPAQEIKYSGNVEIN